jgi:lipopolysaccharide O-acetyltransferase
MRFSSGFTTGPGLRLDAWGDEASPCLFFGRNVQLNDYVHIGAIERVEIGDDVLIASRVFISDHDHGQYDVPDPRCTPDVPPGQRPVVSKPVKIGRNVWVGEQVCILAGVTIGEGSIIGAGSVVTRDVPPNSIAVGSPARCVRRFDRVEMAWKRVG